MASLRQSWLLAGLALLLVASPVSGVVAVPASASEIKVIVNRVPITSYDVQRRAAFMKLQGRKGNLSQLAEDEMIDQTLKLSEMRRIGVNIPNQQVDAAFANFAKSNKMTAKQLDGVLSQSGVTTSHFKEFIRSQMGWGSVVGAWSRDQSKATTEQKAVEQMLKQGGAKPTATEYMLQQVIFVVPAAERGKIAQRKREAEAMRVRFSDCSRTREFAKGLIDVTVRDLGRKFGPELPSDWAEQIKAAKVGGATPVRETDRGVEFIGVCSSREVSDDKVAQMVLSQNGLAAGGEADGAGEETSKKVLAELRAKAKIQRR